MQTCWEVQGAQRCLYTEIQYTRTHAHLFTDTLGMHTSNTGMHIHTGDPQVGTHRVPTYMPICYVRYTYTSICYFLSLFLLGMDLGIHENKYTYKFQSTHTYHTYILCMNTQGAHMYTYNTNTYRNACVSTHIYGCRIERQRIGREIYTPRLDIQSDATFRLTPPVSR